MQAFDDGVSVLEKETQEGFASVQVVHRRPYNASISRLYTQDYSVLGNNVSIPILSTHEMPILNYLMEEERNGRIIGPDFAHALQVHNLEGTIYKPPEEAFEMLHPDKYLVKDELAAKKILQWHAREVRREAWKEVSRINEQIRNSKG